jgi:hypothetical protein
MSPPEFGSEKDCAGEAEQQLKTPDPTSHQRGCPTSTNLHCLIMIKAEEEKLDEVPRWAPFTKTDWPNDCRP